MKTKISVIVVTMVVMVAMGAWAADTKAMAPRAAEPGAAAANAVAGKMAVETKTATATVEAVDPATRMVTLKMPSGESKTFKVGEEAKNFDQVKVGDTVKATLVNAVGVSLRKAGEPPSAEETKTIMLAPKGAKPAGIVSKTEEVTGKIASIDPQTRIVAIEGPEGKMHNFEAGPKIDLSNVKKGDDVVLRYTQALALNLEKAQG